VTEDIDKSRAMAPFAKLYFGPWRISYAAQQVVDDLDRVVLLCLWCAIQQCFAVLELA